MSRDVLALKQRYQTALGATVNPVNDKRKLANLQHSDTYGSEGIATDMQPANELPNQLTNVTKQIGS